MGQDQSMFSSTPVWGLLFFNDSTLHNTTKKSYVSIIQNICLNQNYFQHAIV